MATIQDLYNQLGQMIGSDNINKFASMSGLSTNSTIIIIAIGLIIISIWTLIWKGLALWKSAKNNHKIWFVVILLINTVGILEIIYLYVFSKMNWDKKQKMNKSLNNKKTVKKKRR